MAQEHSFSGYVFHKNEPVPFASVGILGTTTGAATNISGHFVIKDSLPNIVLTINSIGYESKSVSISLNKLSGQSIDTIFLEKSNTQLDALVISGTLKETYVSESPVKIEVVSEEFLKNTTSPINLVQGIQLVNGVTEVVACGVCFTNSISINGLPGQYTAVLMDGAPIYGNLASVYGLNGIPRQIIERFEVIKGPSSTLYGSEAVAGVINIITKDPANQPAVSIDIMATSHLETFGNIAIAPKVKNWKGYVGLNYAFINDFDDHNHDGFGDNVNLDRISAFTKWSLDRKSKKPFTISAKYYYEDRRNGVEAYLNNRAYKQIRGNDSIYGESIYTNRAEIFGSYAFNSKSPLKLDFSLTSHNQNSFYGSDLYAANQKIAFANLLKPIKKGRHDALLGLTNRYQFYDDNSVATQLIGENGNELNRPSKQFIPGVFIQDEVQLASTFKILAGARLDYYYVHGPIFSPRFNFKYTPKNGTTFRGNFGTGFRVVNLFTEDHAFVTGRRQIEIKEELKPEQSYNTSFNYNQFVQIGESVGTLDFDVFYTHFSNKIIPDYSNPNKIVYANSTGFARTFGASIGWQHQLKNGLRFQSGFNYQNATETTVENGELQSSWLMFSPRFTSNTSVNYKLPKTGINLAYTVSVTGKMKLPEVFDLDQNGLPKATGRPEYSKTWAIHNIQASKNLVSKKLRVYAGVQNLFNYRQLWSPLVGFNDPNYAPGFSPYFDTAYSYSPMHGRDIYIGFEWNF
ncbi:MAG: TonB-dependent receptor [Bacteroidetes bacterium]|nr:TonB-dependent receptor [Bacteroidota bacterium]